MSPRISLTPARPQGEGFSALVSSAGEELLPAITVDRAGRRFHVERDPRAPVTPPGQLVFFCQFLAAGGLYSKWVADCPLRNSRPNAPSLKDLPGTWVLASLSGAWRYAHVTALRGDRVNPRGLGMEKVVSEDSFTQILCFVGARMACPNLCSSVLICGQIQRLW
jgi:hypothetical protein